MANHLPEIDIKKELKKIKEKGFVKALRGHNTGIGFTLETLLNIKENNSGEPDFTYKGVPFELKAQRKDASSRVTLFTKVPIWSPMSAREIIEKYGYSDGKDRRALKITLKVDGFNPKGFKLELDKKQNKLNIVHKDAGIVSYFNVEDLMNSLRKKISENLLLVLAERKRKGDDEYFHFVDAMLLRKLNEENFEELLNQGLIVWEFRMDIRKRDNGTDFVRDHGPGFRMARKHLEELYAETSYILD